MEEDRMSQLPDAILQHILSLIDINEAIQTAILSTRWKNLCFSLSDLHFHLTRFAAHTRTTFKNRGAAQSLSHRFSHFVSHFLSHCNDTTTIRSFHLSFDSHLVHADAAFLEECVLYAVNHGVQSLRLHARCRPDLTLPAAFFASETLRELELRNLGYVICIPELLSLPHLKTLYLESSAFVSNDGYYSFLKEPFSGFPELEKLTLRRSSVYGLDVKAPKLRILEIVDQENSYSQMMGEISAPLLTSFRYEGYLPLECSKINLPMLEEVHLDIHKRLEPNNVSNEKRMVLKCVRMLQQLGNAKIVALTLDTLKSSMSCLKLIKGRREIGRVLRRVMNYLTEETLCFESLVVELPQGVHVVEKNSEDLFEDDSDEQQLQLLFGIQDERQ